MLIYLLVIVILLRCLRKEGLTTYLKYKEISHLFKDDISGESHCIYTQIPPQVQKVYNIDFDSPFDRYDTLNIDSKYNVSYYDDTSFNVEMDIEKNEADNIFPFFKTYRYCDLSNSDLSNNIPTCTYLTCGTNEELSTDKIVSHNKGVADLLKSKRLQSKSKTITELNNQRSALSKQYESNEEKYTNYINDLQ